MLPTKSSISLNLSGLYTECLLSKEPYFEDIIKINGNIATPKEAHPIISFLKMCKETFKISQMVNINFRNNFAHAAGMASSASGFASLALAINKLFNLELNQQQLSILARRGSGSACRSTISGFVCWTKGSCDEGSDCYPFQIAASSHWPELRVITVILSSKAKDVSSRSGMQLSMTTSNHYQSWIDKSEQNIPSFMEAISTKNFDLLGTLTQHECDAWHHVLQTTLPPLNYFLPSSYLIMETVKRLHADGIPCYYTTDAGPNIHILCTDSYTEMICTTIQQLALAQHIIVSSIAPEPTIVEIR